MNKFQPFKFYNFDEFYEFINENERAIVLSLKELIYKNIPDIKEKLSFNVPFFYKNRSICFIWPGSVPWGKNIKTGVEFGFSKGYLLNDKNNYLDKGNRKQIYLKRFHSIEEIEVGIITDLLQQAKNIDEKILKRV